MISARSLNARLTLLGAVFKNLAVHLVVRRRGASAWLARLLQEDITPTPAQAWELLPQTSRCIGCGLCDIVGVDGDAGSGLSAWLMGAGRRPQDAGLAVGSAPSLRSRAQAIARVCPARVPVDAIAELIENNAAELARREGAGTPEARG